MYVQHQQRRAIDRPNPRSWDELLAVGLFVLIGGIWIMTGVLPVYWSNDSWRSNVGTLGGYVIPGALWVACGLLAFLRLKALTARLSTITSVCITAWTLWCLWDYWKSNQGNPDRLLGMALHCVPLFITTSLFFLGLWLGRRSVRDR